MDSEMQSEEIVALEAIYQDDLVVDAAENSLSLKLRPIFTQQRVKVDGKELALLNDGELDLPPMTLHASIPIDYPTQKCLTDVNLECAWLGEAKRKEIVAQLVEMWCNDCVLFNWATHLVSGDALMDMIQDDCINLCTGSDAESTRIKELLVEWHAQEKQKRFQTKVFDCEICLSVRKGLQCVAYPCDHVFCKDCVRDYLLSRMQENRPDDVKCPTCSESTLPPPGIAGILADQYPRFEELLEKKQFEQRKDVVWCPRAWCNGPAFRDARLERLVTCRDCQFTFCAVCQKSYHGKAWCNLPALQRIVEEYLKAKESGSKVEIARIEAKYGTKLVQRLEQDYLAEKETILWKKANTTSCPTCHVSIERSEGCNHITCTTCKTHFCFLCGKYLNPDRPYVHFNAPGSSCRQRLFEGSITQPLIEQIQAQQAGQPWPEDLPAEHLAWALNL